MTGPATAITIGAFDGAHLGHSALIRSAREAVGPDGRVIAISFDPHPLAVLRPGSEPAKLTDFDRRAELLHAYGASEVRRLQPEPGLLRLSPRAFIEATVQDLRPDFFVEGPDFRFGRGRAGGLDDLRSLGREFGFAVRVLDEVATELEDQSVVRVSSSVIRWLLGRGRVADAARLLGRRYELAGEVIRGDRLGRTLGFPTVNIDARTLRPMDGVYAAVADLPNGTSLPAAVNVGSRPTVRGLEHRVEAHLLGLPTSWAKGAASDSQAAGEAWSPLDGLAEYGWTCRVGLVAWVRDQVRFGSVADLAAQLARDCARVLDMTDDLPQPAPSTTTSHA